MLTTAHSHTPLPFAERRALHPVAAAYAALWLMTALHTTDLGGWALENVLPVPIVVTLVVIYRWWQLSDVSYILCALFLALHAVGTHYGYTHVPAGEWVRAWTGGERNSYDRLVHLAFGLLIAYPARDLTLRVMGTRHQWPPFHAHLWASFFALGAVFTLAACYEIAEWVIAASVAPDVGAAFLGSQGDVWDPQKDMALAGVGALGSLSAVHCLYRWRYLRPAAAPEPDRGARALQRPGAGVHSEAAGPAQVTGPARLSPRSPAPSRGGLERRRSPVSPE